MALRFQSNVDFTDVPISTNNIRPPAPSTGTTIRRTKTLTRPERSVAPVPLIHSANNGLLNDSSYEGSQIWTIASRIATFWAPGVTLSSIGGLKDKNIRQAWREKVTLCLIILTLCGAVGFATVGTQRVLCPQNSSSTTAFLHLNTTGGVLGVRGQVYNVTDASSSEVDLIGLADVDPGQDITQYFERSASDFSECSGLDFRVALDNPCSTTNPCVLGDLNSSSTFTGLGMVETSFTVGYSWDQVTASPNYFVIDGAVLNMTTYMNLHPTAVPSDNVDAALRTMLQGPSGRDGTRLFYSRSDLQSAVPCLKQRYYAGNIDKVTPGCFASQLILYAGLIVILSLVLIRFIMACIFSWFLSGRLADAPNSNVLNRNAISPAVMPEGANVSVDNKNGTAPWSGQRRLNVNPDRSFGSSTTLTNSSPEGSVAPVMSLAEIGAELFAICLVTCYSEGEESLRTTLDSISRTTYSDARKLLFVVADGMITGAGEKQSTPDICVGLLEADPRFGNPIPMMYEAVGSGEKAINRAMVYAGHYSEFHWCKRLIS